MKIFRYESYWTEYGPVVELRTFEVVRETPCYYWINHTWDPTKQRRVPKDQSAQRWGHSTKVAALKHFRFRQLRRAIHGQNTTRLAMAGASFVDKCMDTWDEPEGIHPLGEFT